MWAGVRPIMRLASCADRDGAAVVDVDRHHGWFIQDDSLAAHVDERVRGTEIDRHVAAHDRREGVAHLRAAIASVQASGGRSEGGRVPTA